MYAIITLGGKQPIYIIYKIHNKKVAGVHIILSGHLLLLFYWRIIKRSKKGCFYEKEILQTGKTFK